MRNRDNAVETTYCSRCSGSGQGSVEWIACGACNGTGEVDDDAHDAYLERRIERAEWLEDHR